MLVFPCHVCKTDLSAEPTQAGQLVRCPSCMTTLRVPAAGVVPAGVAAPMPGPNPGPAWSMPGRVGKRYGFNCGYCSSRFEATEAMAAQDGQCPTCGNNITIPILDRYGRLIDPKTRQIIKQDPHPVHAYAAAGERAPQVVRDTLGKQSIRCARCANINAITTNNCKVCGMPFTMEGTTQEAAGATNGLSVASLVIGILSLMTFYLVLPEILAIVFGLFGYRIGAERSSSRGMAIAGMICGGIASLFAVFYFM